MAYVLFRGEYDKRRDKVEPSTPKRLAADARRIFRTTASASPDG